MWFCAVSVMGGLVWEGAIYVFGVPQYILPSPSNIGLAFWEYRDALAIDLCATAAQSLAGLLLAMIVASIVTVVMAYVPNTRAAVLSGAVALKSVPILILAPIFLLWFGYGHTGKIVLAAIIAVFPIIIAGAEGTMRISQHERDLFRILGASRWQTVRKLIAPRSTRFVLAGLKMAAPMAVLGSLIGESAGSRHGLGMTLMIASANLNSGLVFAAAILSSALGIGAFVCVGLLERPLGKYLYV